MSGRWGPFRGAVGCARRLLLAAAALALLALPARAVEPGEITFESGDGYGRMVLNFPGRLSLPPHSVSTANGVLVVAFDEPVAVSVDRVAEALGVVVSAARSDPDGLGLRFALRAAVTVNTMPAGGRLFIDLMPPGWRGPPPPLPQSAVDELARIAEEAVRRAALAAVEVTPNGETPALTMRVGRNPTFTRLSFTWNVPFEAAFARDGDAVRVTFNRHGEADLTALAGDLPPLVEGIRSETAEEGGRTSVLLQLAATADVRGFRDGEAYVVDISGPPGAEAMEGPLASMNEAVGLAPDAAASEAVDAPGVPAPMPLQADPVPPPEPTAAPPAPAATPAEMPPGTRPVLAGDSVHVEVERIGSVTRLAFAYPEETPAAAFMRRGALWLVFDNARPLDLDDLRQGLAGLASGISLLPQDGASVVRIELADALLASLQPEATHWVLTLGDMAVAPTRPLALERTVRADGSAALQVAFGDVGRIRTLADPQAGDRMVVVTAAGPPRGLIREQAFVEFDALASIQGLAFALRADDVEVFAEPPAVVIGRSGGLTLSDATGPAMLGDIAPEAIVPDELGFLDLTGLAARNIPAFRRLQTDILSGASGAASAEEQRAARYRLAAFLVANELGPEALGVLDLIATTEPDEAGKPGFQLLLGASELLAGRPGAALAVLGAPALAERSDAEVWRVLAHGALGEHGAARAGFARAATAVDRFPEPIRVRFLIASTEAAIAAGDVGTAGSLLATLDPQGLAGSALTHYRLVEGRIALASDRPDEAMEDFRVASERGQGPFAAEARYRLIEAQLAEGQVTPEQALDKLERLAVAWRGDAIELMVLRSLGNLAAATGDPRRGFAAMRSAFLVDPDAATTHLLQDEMAAVFSQLFIGGGADALDPVEALSLFYDFRELTPIGHRGDQMVRRLADRLVDVDLLAQAAELLQHQIDERLAGAARAQVAADLALVYILDRRPERAILALHRSRQADLPAAVERRRRLVEARAQSDAGEPDIALELLASLDEDDEVRSLRAEVNWAAGRHQAAAEAYEALLGRRWSDTLALSDEEAAAVMRSAVAYALASDSLGRDRLRQKFLAKMSETDSSAAFELVTGATGDDLRTVAERLAEVDTMDRFLADYRRRYHSADVADLADAGAPPAI
jgi:hypothetical protein